MFLSIPKLAQHQSASNFFRKEGGVKLESRRRSETNKSPKSVLRLVASTAFSCALGSRHELPGSFPLVERMTTLVPAPKISHPQLGD